MSSHIRRPAFALVRAMRLSLSAAAFAGAAAPALAASPMREAPAGMVESWRPDCNGVAVERTAWLMGTELRATVCAATRDAGFAAIEAAFARVRRLEARLSTWRSDSELSRLNAAPPGRWVSLSPETAGLLAEARGWTEATGGAFDPAVGAAIDAWDLRGGGRVPGALELAALRPGRGPRAWEVDEDPPRARHGSGVKLDAGAFGKGAGLRAAAAELRAAGVTALLLDFGGQILAWSRDDDAAWTIAVADPEQRHRPALRLRIGAGSVSTTAASERFVSTAAGRMGHVIDPRTGRPVPAWGSVTVIADDPVAADALSTALFVMGRRKALAWSRTSGVGVLILESADDGPRIYHNNALDAVASIKGVESHES